MYIVFCSSYDYCCSNLWVNKPLTFILICVYYIQSEPLINATNEKLIHHMLLYVCAKLPAQYANLNFFECGPKSSDNFVMKYCQSLIGGWAMGSAVRSILLFFLDWSCNMLIRCIYFSIILDGLGDEVWAFWRGSTIHTGNVGSASCAADSLQQSRTAK